MAVTRLFSKNLRSGLCQILQAESCISPLSSLLPPTNQASTAVPNSAPQPAPQQAPHPAQLSSTPVDHQTVPVLPTLLPVLQPPTIQPGTEAPHAPLHNAPHTVQLAPEPVGQHAVPPLLPGPGALVLDDPAVIDAGPHNANDHPDSVPTFNPQSTLDPMAVPFADTNETADQMQKKTRGKAK